MAVTRPLKPALQRHDEGTLIPELLVGHKAAVISDSRKKQEPIQKGVPTNTRESRGKALDTIEAARRG
jgi:hypothetical protein